MVNSMRVLKSRGGAAFVGMDQSNSYKRAGRLLLNCGKTLGKCIVGAATAFLAFSPLTSSAEPPKVRARTLQLDDSIPNDWQQATPTNLSRGRVMLVVGASSDGIRDVVSYFPKRFFRFLRTNKVNARHMNFEDLGSLKGKVHLHEPTPGDDFWWLIVPGLPKVKVNAVPVVIFAENGRIKKVLTKPDFDADGISLKNAARQAFGLPDPIENLPKLTNPLKDLQDDTDRLRREREEMLRRMAELQRQLRQLGKELNKDDDGPKQKGSLQAILPPKQLYNGQLQSSRLFSINKFLMFSLHANTLDYSWNNERTLSTFVDSELLFRVARGWNTLAVYVGPGGFATFLDPSIHTHNASLESDMRGGGPKVVAGFVVDTNAFKLFAKFSGGAKFNDYKTERKGSEASPIDVEHKDVFGYIDCGIDAFITKWISLGFNYSSSDFIGMSGHLSLAAPPFLIFDSIEGMAKFRRHDVLTNMGFDSETVTSLNAVVQVPIRFGKHVMLGPLYSVNKDWLPVPTDVNHGPGGILTLGPLSISGGYMFNDRGGPFAMVHLNISDLIHASGNVLNISNFPFQTANGQFRLSY